MRLKKLRLVSIGCAGLAGALFIKQHFTKDLDASLILVLCLIASAIELIRLELRDLRRLSEEMKPNDTSK